MLKFEHFQKNDRIGKNEKDTKIDHNPVENIYINKSRTKKFFYL